MATVLHGYARLTADIDVVIDLSPEPARKAIEARQALGLAPRAPVVATDFADPLVRAQWVREKGLEVFSMVDRNHPLRVVELFVHHPIAFDDLWSRSEVVDLSSTSVRIAAIDDLIRRKRLSGRPQDLEDNHAARADKARAGQEQADGIERE